MSSFFCLFAPPSINRPSPLLIDTPLLPNCLATGEYIGVFGLTEPNHGSDPASMETRARKGTRADGVMRFFLQTLSSAKWGARASFAFCLSKLCYARLTKRRC